MSLFTQTDTDCRSTLPWAAFKRSSSSSSAAREEAIAVFLPSAASSIAARELSSKGRFYRKERRKKKWRETQRSGVVLKDMMGKGTARCFEFKEGEGVQSFRGHALFACSFLPLPFSWASLWSQIGGGGGGVGHLERRDKLFQKCPVTPAKVAALFG